jgi:hypothetical protein
MRAEDHHYLVMQIRELLDKHLGTSIKDQGLWRIQSLIHDEKEDAERRSANP